MTPDPMPRHDSGKEQKNLGSDTVPQNTFNEMTPAQQVRASQLC
jgi:hypothetical protein